MTCVCVCMCGLLIHSFSPPYPSHLCSPSFFLSPYSLSVSHTFTHKTVKVILVCQWVRFSPIRLELSISGTEVFFCLSLSLSLCLCLCVCVWERESVCKTVYNLLQIPCIWTDKETTIASLPVQSSMFCSLFPQSSWTPVICQSTTTCIVPVVLVVFILVV